MDTVYARVTLHDHLTLTLDYARRTGAYARIPVWLMDEQANRLEAEAAQSRAAARMDPAQRRTSNTTIRYR